MRSQGPLVVALSFVALAGAWFLFGGGGEPASPDVPTAPATDPGKPADAGDAAHAAAAPAPAPADAATAAARQVVTPLPTAGASALCTVSGRLVDRKGTPRTGLELRWSTWGAGLEAFEAGELPFPRRGTPGERESVRTDVDGRFRIAVPKGREGNLELDVREHVFQKGQGGFSTARGDVDLGDLRVLVPARLSGVVVDVHGQPVAGVKVGADAARLGLGLRSEAMSDAKGRFEIIGLHGGTWHVRTLSAQFLPAALSVDIVDEEQKGGLEIKVTQGQAIAGQVVDDRGLGVAGALVGCMRKEKSGGVSIERFSSDESSTTDEHGYFTLGGLGSDAVTVRATAKGHGRALKANVAVGTGNLVLEMQRHGSIAGVLRDPAGQPIADSRISAGPARAEQGLVDGHELDIDLPRFNSQVTTAADGSFRIDDVAPGLVTVRAHGKTHRPVQSQGLTLQPAQVLEGVRLVAETGALVVASVVDADGKPVPDAKVEVREPPEPQQPAGPGSSRVTRRMRVASDDGGERFSIGDGPRRLGSATTDLEGRAEIGGLPAGDAVVSCTHGELADARPFPTVLPAHGSVEVRLVLRQPGTARLQVTSPLGAAAAADYKVHGPIGPQEAARDRKGKTSVDGTAHLTSLPPGDYWAELQLPAKPQEMGGGAMVMLAGDNAKSVAGTRLDFRVEAGKETTVALRLPQLTRVHGTVRSVDGPAANVAIELLAEGEEPDAAPGMPGGSTLRARTAADGSYAIDDVMPGRYRLRWGKQEQLVKASADVDIPANQPELRRDLDLRYGKLRVQAVSKDGKTPVAGAEVELVAATADGSPPRQQRRVMMFTASIQGDNGAESSTMTMGAAKAETDAEGIAEISDVPPGRYVVRIRHDQYAPHQVPDQTVAEAATTDCGRVELTGAGRIRGRVLDADGKAVPMALVTCQKKGATGEPDRQPALGGGFAFPGLAPGTYLLRAQGIGPGDSGEGPELEVEVEAGKTAAGIEVRLAPR